MLQPAGSAVPAGAEVLSDDEDVVVDGVAGLDGDVELVEGVDGEDGLVGAADEDEEVEPPLVGAPTEGAPPGPQAAMPTTAVALREATAIRVRVVRMSIPFVGDVGNTTGAPPERFHASPDQLPVVSTIR
ncbi:hypothetical protein JOB34_04745 [Allobranchiibius sp. GilTou38]|nr:hypothetical protein [Allobranchiibius sp. GilTou38]